MHAQKAHEPPTSSRSTTATKPPRDAARCPAASPAAPVPMITKSNLSSMRGAYPASETSILLSCDRSPELFLVHSRAAANVQLACPVHELRLRRAIDIDATEGLALAISSRCAALCRLGIGRTLPLLRLPVVVDLLERVLQRGESRSVRSLALAIGIDGAVVSLHPRLLGLLRRTLERAGNLVACGHEHLQSCQEFVIRDSDDAVDV